MDDKTVAYSEDEQNAMNIEMSVYLPAGVVLRGRYKIINVIGVGGFGITYKAQDLLLSDYVAIKEYYPMGMANRMKDTLTVSVYTEAGVEAFSQGKQRFLKEAQDLARFNKEDSIVSISDFFEANNTAYMVMEYLKGCTLKEYLDSNDGKISEDMMIQVTFSIMEALDTIHKAGLIHRDVSPDNIFICDDSSVKLIDFGAAKQDMKGMAKTVSVVLKYGYAPIEQYSKKSELGPWTDIYALGATMYKMVTGNVPDESIERVVNDELVEPKEINERVSDSFNRVIMKALSVKHVDRYQSIAEMREDYYDLHTKTENYRDISDDTIVEDLNKVSNSDVWNKVKVIFVSLLLVGGLTIVIINNIKYSSNDNVSSNNMELETNTGGENTTGGITNVQSTTEETTTEQATTEGYVTSRKKGEVGEIIEIKSLNEDICKIIIDSAEVKKVNSFNGGPCDGIEILFHSNDENWAKSIIKHKTSLHYIDENRLVDEDDYWLEIDDEINGIYVLKIYKNLPPGKYEFKLGIGLFEGKNYSNYSIMFELY